MLDYRLRMFLSVFPYQSKETKARSHHNEAVPIDDLTKVF